MDYISVAKQSRMKAILLFCLFMSFHMPACLADKYTDGLETEATTTSVTPKRQGNNTQGSTNKTKQPVDYLEGLASEANDTTIDEASSVSTKELQEKSRKTENVNWDISRQKLGTLTPDLNAEQFEETLKNNFFASYVFYQKLDATSRRLIYKEYLKEPNIDYLRKRIISLAK